MRAPVRTRATASITRALSFAGLLLGIVALISWSWIESPKYPQLGHFGDDAEYLLGAQSFVRHGSPEFRPGDELDTLAALPRGWARSAVRKYSLPQPTGYFPSLRGEMFCWHFWSYAAAVAPLKAALDRRSIGVRAFHYTNLLFFSAALLSLQQLWARPALAFALLSFAFLTPILWFLPIAHTEPFVFSLGLIASACYLSKRRLLAVLFSALAATQFQPLVVVTFYLCVESLWHYAGRRFAIKQLARDPWRVLACLAFASVALVPDVFYAHHFGTPSLVTREGYASSKLISLDKLSSMFFDLNTGMLVYLPGILLLFIASCGMALRRSVRLRSLAPLLVPGSVLLSLWISTSARIWNYHTQGISRYALYTVPCLLLAIALEFGGQRRERWPVFLTLMAAAALQLLVHREFGLFEYRGNNNLHHNQIALYVLERWPRLYAPPSEIFCSRTLHRRCWIDLATGYVTDEFLPAVQRDQAGVPVKALVKPCALDATRIGHAWTPEQLARIERAAGDCQNAAPRYVDFR